jgi:uncharacterized membrane protein
MIRLLFLLSLLSVNLFGNVLTAEESTLTPPKEISHSHDHDDGKPHDHAKDHGSSSWSVSAVIGRLHPIFVHFPIAGIFFAFFLQMAGSIFQKKDFDFAVGFTLALTSIFALIAAVSGWINASTGSFSGEDVQLIYNHRWLAVGALISLWLCTTVHFFILKNKVKWHSIFMILLILSIILVSATGHYGGQLVFGADYFSF